MSVTKIQKVKSLKKIVAYATQNHKTNSDLITSYKCDVNSIEKDFENVLLEYNFRKRTNKELSSRMIIQSFDKNDNVTPEEAHQYGTEFAENYLKGKHQFLVVTHIETDNVHNHIIFNDIAFDDFKYFDSKRENSLHRLRFENDKISEKYGLNIIEEGKKKNKYLDFKEYTVRLKGKSFKAQLENAIDKNIELAKDYDDFLKLMKEDGYESKQGKYLAFQNPKSDKFMRTKTLGVNYFENSIKFRIENKDYPIIKPNLIEKEWIDKTADKFKNNKGLERWATIQNINYLHEVNSYLNKEKITLQQYGEMKENAKMLFESFGEKLEKKDTEIFELEDMAGTFKAYENCYDVMAQYKAIEGQEQKAAYKKANYATFKQFDKAKRNIKTLKEKYGINDEYDYQYKLSSFKMERDVLYQSLNANVKNIEIAKANQKEQNKEFEQQQKQNQKRKNRDHER